MSRTLKATLVLWSIAMPVSASAATLITPPLYADAGVAYVRCSLSNVGPKEATVRVEVLDDTGAVTADTGEFTLASGTTYSNAFGFDDVNLCRFTVGSKRKFRASACISNFGTLTCKVQADAQ